MEDVLHVAALDREEAFHPIDLSASPEFTLLALDRFHEEVIGAMVSHLCLHLVRESADARVMTCFLRLLQNFAVNLESTLQAEHVQIEQLDESQLIVVELDLVDHRVLIVLSDLRRRHVQLLTGAQVCLVEEDLVGEANLLDGLVHLALLSVVLEALHDVASIANGEAAVNPRPLFDLFIQEESLQDLAWVGHSSRFDYDVVDFAGVLVLLFHFQYSLDQVFTHSAADASIHDFDDGLLCVANLILHQFVIDADSAKLVLDDGDTLAMALAQDANQKCGFARAKESSDNCDWNRGAFRQERPVGKI